MTELERGLIRLLRTLRETAEAIDDTRTDLLDSFPRRIGEEWDPERLTEDLSGAAWAVEMIESAIGYNCPPRVSFPKRPAGDEAEERLGDGQGEADTPLTVDG